MDAQDEPTFDPRKWGSSRREKTAAQLAAPADAPAPAPAPAPVKKSNRMVLSIVGSACLLASGFVAAWLSRETPREHIAARPIESAIETPTQPHISLSQRILILDSPAGLESALVANRIDKEEAAKVARAALAAIGSRNETVRAAIYLDSSAPQPQLVRMEASFIDSSGVTATRQPDGTFVTNVVKPSLNSEIIFRRGEMNDTDFYSSAVTAGITDSLIQTFAQAFAFDFNFQTEITTGDVFEAAFEQQVNASHQSVGPPRLLYASFLTKTKFKALYHFRVAGGQEQWFDGYGRSVRRSFMRTPIDGARISSHFGMRFHPVLHYTRLHGGTDFAAPIGTPIYASAAGNVTTASPSSCAGNMVILKHDNGWETRYFHMLHYAPDIHVGGRVEQGHELGVVGVTGICTTGPHLHYEVHINGEKVDPETIPTEQGEKLSGAALAAFTKERDRIDVAKAHQAN